MYPILYSNNRYLFFRCLERDCEEERNEKKQKKSKEIVEVLQHASYYRKKRKGN